MKEQNMMKLVSKRAPAVVGSRLSNVETPCLMIDLDRMERNLRFLPETIKSDYPSVKIRPHAKAHKCSEIGKIQQHLSEAIGLCCQKVCEAEAMVNNGIKDILLSNEIIGMKRYERMAHLASISGTKISLVFDNEMAISQASAVAHDCQVQFHALVEVNVGQNRCGVDSKEEVLHLAELINKSPGLQFSGIQAYHGAAQHIREFDEMKDVISNVSNKASGVKEYLEENNITCNVVTGGGTGTYMFEASSGVFTEIQPGSYIFNDADYSRNLNEKGKFVSVWEQSLFVLSTVMSSNRNQGYAVIDAGMKAVSLDSGPPLVKTSQLESPLYEPAGDEHGKIVLKDNSQLLPEVGTLVWLIPGHCDPTVNLYDFVVGFRGDKVEEVWEVNGRSPGN